MVGELFDKRIAMVVVLVNFRLDRYRTSEIKCWRGRMMVIMMVVVVVVVVPKRFTGGVDRAILSQQR